METVAGKRPDDPSAYIFRAVSLNAIKWHTRRRHHVSLDAVGEMAQNADPAAPDPAAVEQAIARLPSKQQTVVRMRFYLGLSLKQIGKSLSISSNTAASRCRYDLSRLRSSLRHETHKK